MKKAIAAAAPMDDYQAQDDMRTLTSAEEIKADAKRHGKALSHGKQQMSALQNVVGEGAGDKDAGGLKEGSKAEEALDAKEAKGKKAPVAMKGLRVAQRVPSRNSSRVL